MFECVYAYARVFCIQTRYDSLRFLAAFVAHSLCEIHHTHTGIRTLTHTQSKGRYCSRWRIVIVLYTLTFLFTSFPVSIARMHYTHTTAARAPPASPLFIVSMFFYLGLFAFFLDSNNHLSTSPAPFYFAFSAVFYFLVTFILHLCCYEKLEGNIMLFRIIQLS